MTEPTKAASIRQRRELTRWAKGKLIKVRYEQEFIRLGWITSRLVRFYGGCSMEYGLTGAGHEIVGVGKKIVVPVFTEPSQP